MEDPENIRSHPSRCARQSGGARFFLFLVPAAELRAEVISWDVDGLGVPSACDGAGVAEDRPIVAEAGVSGTIASDVAVGSVKDLFACKAVVRMALNIRALFCVRFAFACPAEVLLSLLTEALLRACVAADVSAMLPSASRPRFLDASVVVVASLIGQTKPVRGVYAGRCCRRVSREVCRECNDVSKRLETRVYTSGLWYIRLFMMKYATSGRTLSHSAINQI
jgi:hypothetical protein